MSALGLEVCINKVEPFTIPSGTGPDLDGDSTLITMTMWNSTDATVRIPDGPYDNRVSLLALRGDSGMSGVWDAGSERFPFTMRPDEIVTRRFVDRTNYTSADDRRVDWHDLTWWEYPDRQSLPSPTPR
ncbi:MAG: hypothetical protein L0G99_16150 [Propionibacteriales bacterium]|nr:hypothetical protein [Propionibacteriales bacterium]